MTDKTIGGCVRTPCPDAFYRSSIHLATTWITRDARPQHWRRLWEHSLIQSPAKMTTPSGSSSGRERKTILNGAKPLKEDSWQANDNYKLSSRRQ
ncbi:hypothetical protein AAG906_020255 [Vitis piasezkii]